MIDFLTNCGNKNLQYLLVPARLDSALAQMDTDRDGSSLLKRMGGRDRDRAVQQAGAARRRARGAAQGGGEGDCGIHGRVPQRGELRAHRQGRRRHAVDGRDRLGQCIFHGAFMLNRRVDLDIDATPARWRGGAGYSPLDGVVVAEKSIQLTA